MAASKRVGQRTIKFQEPPVILAAACLGGRKEKEGPLSDIFDATVDDNYYGEKTFEKAEQKMLQESMERALKKAQLKTSDMDYMLAGDLLNQIISADFTARALEIPFIGLYGACSTMYESLALGAMLIDGGYAEKVLIGASSHYCTAERQYRFPVEQGSQRAMTAQWTVTGAGAMVLAKSGKGPKIRGAVIGKVLDLGEKDANNMGAVMAPAAADTIVSFLQDTQMRPADLGCIVSGDLGRIGHKLTLDLVGNAGYDISRNFQDCGLLIYDQAQDTHAGGSGCGCSAVVTCGYLLREMARGKLPHFLGVGTGALLSPASSQQGNSIPGIAHGVLIEA